MELEDQVVVIIDGKCVEGTVYSVKPCGDKVTVLLQNNEWWVGSRAKVIGLDGQTHLF